MKFVKNNKKMLLGLGVFIILSFSIYHFVISKNNLEQIVSINFSEGTCAVQYNTCAFFEMKNEPWERSCDPIFKYYEVIQIGNKKVLLKDLSNDTQSVFPKHLFRDKSKINEDAISNSMYVYLSDCNKVKKITTIASPQKKEDIKKEEIQPPVVNDEISDKCITLDNNCETPERWEEDVKYCHPFKNAYKVLEVGTESLRVVAWHGHGQTNLGKVIPIGTELKISKEEYTKLGYKEQDCSDLVIKYPKTFNPNKGK